MNYNSKVHRLYPFRGPFNPGGPGPGDKKTRVASRVQYPGAVVTVRPGDMVASLQRSGLGDLASTLSSLLSTGVDITTDPYFPEVLCRIQQLAAIQSNQAVPACTNTPSGLPGGVGLDALIWPLRYYVYAKQNIWVIPATIFAVLYIPFAIGRSWDK